MYGESSLPSAKGLKQVSRLMYTERKGTREGKFSSQKPLLIYYTTVCFSANRSGYLTLHPMPDETMRVGIREMI